MSFVGMCSKIKNYYKRKPDNDKGPKEYKYGELTYAHTSPFLGTMTPGQTIQSIENNMYRCPIYEHKLPSTDFIVIRTRTEFSIRECNAFFVCGQQSPLSESRGPTPRRSTISRGTSSKCLSTVCSGSLVILPRGSRWTISRRRSPPTPSPASGSV